MRIVSLCCTALVCVSACADTPVGTRCQPGDREFCGEGFQCLTFCDATTGPESICTPSFGAEAGDTFPNEGLIDTKPAFGELGNVRRFEQNLRIEIQDVKGVALPLVEEVAGNLSIVATNKLECLSLPRLTTVGGVITIDLNEELVTNDLGALEAAGGLIVTDNPKIEEMVWSSVTSFAGDVIVSRNRALHFMNMESLTRVDGDFIITNNAIDRLDLDVLGEVSLCVDVAYDAGACSEPPALADVECCNAAVRRSGCAACPVP